MDPDPLAFWQTTTIENRTVSIKSQHNPVFVHCAMIFFGEDALRKAVYEFVVHYHTERNHQALGNRLIVPVMTEDTTGPVERRQRLGGLLNYYHRQAA
jgi:hypothetical protein